MTTPFSIKSPICGHCHTLGREVEVDIKHREEGEDIGDNDHEVGERKAKHRGKVLPHIASACAVLANLRHRILKEDEDADDDNEDTTTNLYCGVVLIYRALQEGIYRK